MNYLTNEHPDKKKRRRAKLRDVDVLFIRRSTHPRWYLAGLFNVGEYTIRDIRQYRTWAWLD